MFSLSGKGREMGRERGLENAGCGDSRDERKMR